MRKFPELEDLLCFGCSAREAMYKDTEKKELYICKEYADKIWSASLDGKSERFDGCGLLAGETEEENHFFDKDEERLGYIIPSEVFKDFDEFINTLRIPYYEHYKIVVANKNERECFNNNEFLKPLISLLLILILII